MSQAARPTAPLADLHRRTAQTVKRMRQAIAARGMFLTADDRVSESDAAELLGYALGTLRNMRGVGGGPAFFNRPLGGFAKSYRLDDLAGWLEQSREETL